MATVYLAGGINGLTDAGCIDWREKAKGLLDEFKFRDPMVRDYRGKEGDNTKAIVWGDLWDIFRSKYILVNATRPSWGTAMEVVYARLMGKKVFAFVGEAPVSPWLRFHSTYVSPTLEDCCFNIWMHSVYGSTFSI